MLTIRATGTTRANPPIQQTEMDTENIRNMQRISGGDPDEKIYKLLTFAGSGLDVADPWYTGDFEATYKDVKAGCEGLLHTLAEEIM